MLIGPGGAGKGTVAARLVEGDPRLRLSRSWTTRRRRPTEPETAYHFVDRPTFEARIEAGGFLEWAEFLGELYGTPWPEMADGDVLLEIEVQGAEQVRRRHPEAVITLLLPPSWDELAERMQRRGDSGEQIARRLKKGHEEEATGRRLAHHVVVNDELEATVAEVADIIERSREGATG